MKNNFVQYIRKHWVLLLSLFLIPIVAVILLMLNSQWRLARSDWAVIVGAIITYAGTMLISGVSLYQSERANSLSEKVFEMSERGYRPIFSIEMVEKAEIQQCLYYGGPQKNRIMAEQISFCRVDCTPEKCSGYKIWIRNYGEYPITHIAISTTYPIGQKGQLETVEKETETLIAPHGMAEYLLCNTPSFRAGFDGVKFRIVCQNLFGYKTTLDLRISWITEADGEKQLIYSQMLVNDQRNIERQV